MRQEKTIRFGSAEITITVHQNRGAVEVEHDAILKIDGELDKIFMQNEVIDLVSYELGTNPLQHEIIKRDYKKIGHNKFAIKWTTKKRGL
jgi:hypothetical protein